MAPQRNAVGSLANATLMILLLYAVSVPFYMYVEGFSPLDSAYFVTASITSAGYGDIVPATDTGRLFSIFLLLAGVSIFFYHVIHFGRFRERRIDPHIRRRLEVLRDLATLQTGTVKQEEIDAIKDKLASKGGGKPAR